MHGGGDDDVLLIVVEGGLLLRVVVVAVGIVGGERGGRTLLGVGGTIAGGDGMIGSDGGASVGGLCVNDIMDEKKDENWCNVNSSQFIKVLRPLKTLVIHQTASRLMLYLDEK